MCDYSLHSIENRLAQEGEQLVIRRFKTGSKGLAPATPMLEGRQGFQLSKPTTWLNWLWPAEKQVSECAVCIPPGAKLTLSGINKDLRARYGLKSTEEVVFFQVTDEPFRYRDAFRFENGSEVLVQKFEDGVRATVNCLELVEEQEEVYVEPVRAERARSFAHV